MLANKLQNFLVKKKKQQPKNVNTSDKCKTAAHDQGKHMLKLVYCIEA